MYQDSGGKLGMRALGLGLMGLSLNFLGWVEGAAGGGEHSSAIVIIPIRLAHARCNGRASERM